MEVAVAPESPEVAPRVPWPASHPSISLAVLFALGMAFVVAAAMAGLSNDIADWFF